MNPPITAPEVLTQLESLRQVQHRLQHLDERLADTQACPRASAIALEAIAIELDVPVLACEAQAPQTKSVREQAKALLERIYKAIVNAFKWLLDWIVGANNTQAVRRTQMEAALQRNREQHEQLRRDRQYGLPTAASLRNVRLTMGLSIDQKVDSTSITLNLRTQAMQLRELGGFARLQSATLLKAQERFSSGQYGNPEDMRLPVSVGIASVRTPVANNDKRLRIYEGPALLGERALQYMGFDPKLKVGDFRNTSNSDLAVPYVSMHHGLSLQARARGETRVGDRLKILGPREIQEMLYAARELLDAVKQNEGTLEAAIRQANKALRIRQGEPVEAGGTRALGYLRDYVIGVAQELSGVSISYNDQCLQSLNLVNEYIRLSLKQYVKGPIHEQPTV